MGLQRRSLLRRRVLEGEDNPPPPDENSAQIMAFIDRQKPEVRRLIHEYGFNIVTESLDGSPDTLEWDLETWRERRQDAIARGEWK